MCLCHSCLIKFFPTQLPNKVQLGVSWFKCAMIKSNGQCKSTLPTTHFGMRRTPGVDLAAGEGSKHVITLSRTRAVLIRACVPMIKSNSNAQAPTAKVCQKCLGTRMLPEIGPKNLSCLVSGMEHRKGSQKWLGHRRGMGGQDRSRQTSAYH